MPDSNPDREPTRDPFAPSEATTDPEDAREPGRDERPFQARPSRPTPPAFTPAPYEPRSYDDATEEEEEGDRPSLVAPMLLLIAGVVVLAGAVAAGQPISTASVLGVLLLLSAAVRFEIARRA